MNMKLLEWATVHWLLRLRAGARRGGSGRRVSRGNRLLDFFFVVVIEEFRNSGLFGSL